MRDGSFAEAEKAASSIANEIVMGHLQAERLLHRDYRSSYRELFDWMKLYADLPSARTIHTLTMKRRGRNPAPPGVEAPVVDGMLDLFDSSALPEAGDAKPAVGMLDRPREERGRMSAVRQRVRQLLGKGDFEGAGKVLAAGEKRGLAEADRILVLGDIARFAFFAGRDERAVELVPLDGEGPVVARWFAGLSAWRLGRHEIARQHFEAVARAPDLSGWMTAAAAFWASRTHRALGAGDAMQAALRQAADHPTTFYGQLASRQLGNLAAYGEGTDRPEIEVDRLIGIPAMRRAIALVEVGEPALAIDELVALARAAPTAVADSVVAFARTAGLRRAVPRITAAIREAEGALFDDAMYPMPRWAPEGGFTVDRALMFAIIKQESNFRMHLVSPAGALGLMQIMPKTAAFIGPDSLRGRDLHDPGVNLAVGQRYIRHLLEQDPIRGNIIFTVAAYNGGIGRVTRWLSEIRHNDDPLLFMEAIPTAETRQFVERVVSAMWIYQRRLGDRTASLDAVAAGQWPVYGSGEDAQRPSIASTEGARVED
ncbi:soluble lytic murein transglycosylase-like protein [Stella humosa]|uniref:Soluble lytic murein transglycosylase-like protein n=1 Tax=Stella humosa TaxID=94 RepID=A0A3N1L406_9PROT|nr:lytic transglycosylase domain-containing protein [Stella humosa]ROP84135.1 soluble lytic murein transglycosylase-like protein [Stella humosa]BBK33645.1 lytic transglycosylase [Stella humosa]